MLEEIIIAVKSYLTAHHFIVKHKLWKWIVIPGIVYAILFGAGMYFFVHSAVVVIDYFFSKTGLKSWLEKEPDNGIRYIFILGQLILHIILMLVYFSWFKYLFLIVGSPVFAWLSEKTEAMIHGTEHQFNGRKYLRTIARGIQIAVRNSLWQTVYSISIVLLSLLPLIGWATPVLAIFVECYYFGFSMLDYTSERKGLSSAQSIDRIGNHKGLAIGNGMVFFLMHSVLVVGWVLAPGYAVIAATLSLQDEKNKTLKTSPHL